MLFINDRAFYKQKQKIPSKKHDPKQSKDNDF